MMATNSVIAEDELLRSVDVVKLTGLSYRKLDYWCRNGLISPVVEASGSGSQRLFHPDTVAHIEDLLRRIADCPLKHNHYT